MAGSKITVIGGDAFHYREATGQISRLIRFTDGLSRLICLTDWQWKVYDRWPALLGFHQDQLLAEALDIATRIDAEYGPSNFECRVRTVLIELLNVFKVDCCPLSLDAVNENTLSS